MINLSRYAAILGSALMVAGRTPTAPAQQSLPPPHTAPDASPDAAPAETQPGVEVLGRGPVHEAFAQPTATDPKPGPEVPKAPPAPINEVPPSDKPEGPNVEWIPGYWSWDADRNDYLWVSGMWRAAPPNRHWVSGTWVKEDTSFRWIHGYWDAVQPNRASQVVEQPPPASLEQGPSAPAPNDNSVYVPGCWVHTETGYRWRPGFWTTAQTDWVWNPDQYYWTPAGYQFVRGYWDYPFEDRGTLFAPVAFDSSVSLAGFTYYPQYVVSYPGLFDSLFVNPLYRSYYFGDYYGRNYLGLGFYPWFSWGYGYRHYDPLWHHHDWYSRRYGNGNWYNGYRTAYDARLRGDYARPPRTLAQQHTFNRNVGNTIVNNNRVTVNNVNSGNQLLTHYNQVQHHLGPTNVAAGNFRGPGFRGAGQEVTTNFRSPAVTGQRPSVGTFAGTLNNRGPSVAAQPTRPLVTAPNARPGVSPQPSRPFAAAPNGAPYQ